MSKRWLSPEEAERIAAKNRAAWNGTPAPVPYSAAATQVRLESAGRKQRKALPAPSETSECYAFIAWTKLVTFHGEPLFERVVKIPNERGKSGVQTAILIGIGMRPGFPDYSIHAPAGRWHGLYLEAKKRSGGSIEADQLAWREKLRRWGYHSEICEGADAMIQATRDYFIRAGCIADGSWIDRTDFRTRGPST